MLRNTGLPAYSDTSYSDIPATVTVFWSIKGPSYTENPGYNDILITVTLFGRPNTVPVSGDACTIFNNFFQNSTNSPSSTSTGLFVYLVSHSHNWTHHPSFSPPVPFFALHAYLVFFWRVACTQVLLFGVDHHMFLLYEPA